MKIIETDTALSSTTIIKTDTLFSKNKAMNKGGAIYIKYDTITTGEAFFFSNQAQFGGAIYFYKPSKKVIQLKLLSLHRSIYNQNQFV